MTRLERRSLGRSGLEVSAFAIGSWRTFERIPLEQGADVLREARRCGIDFMDVARYDDETGSAPIRSGYSEVVFGEAFRAAGVIREEVVVAEKLWWEHWPRQSARAELDESLERLGFDRVDLIYSDPPPADLPDGARRGGDRRTARRRARAGVGRRELARRQDRGGLRRCRARRGCPRWRPSSCPTASCGDRPSRTPACKRCWSAWARASSRPMRCSAAC